MYKRNALRKFGRKTGPRGLMLRSLATNIILHERVKTTEAKAKEVRSLVEKCVTLGKEPSLFHRRRLTQLLASPPAVAKVLEVLGPRYQERAGGYTRISKIGRRVGDGAPVVNIEFV